MSNTLKGLGVKPTHASVIKNFFSTSPPPQLNTYKYVSAYARPEASFFADGERPENVAKTSSNT